MHLWFFTWIHTWNKRRYAEYEKSSGEKVRQDERKLSEL